MEEDPLSQSPVGQETEDSSTSLDPFVKLESEAETGEVESSESEVLVCDAILSREEDPRDAQVGLPTRRKPSHSPLGRETEDSSTSFDLFVKLESEAETSEVESSESEVLVCDAILPREEDPGGAQAGIPARRKPYVCKYCEEAFGDRYSLKLHAAKHQGEKRFNCTECGNAYLHRHELMYHIRRNHTGERPYACTQCDSAFIVKSHLMSHEQIHARKKALVCGKCGKMYLARHGKSPAGSDPSRCGQCEKAYAGNSNLTKHVKVHACKADLATHIRVHTSPMRPVREGVVTQEGADKTPEGARKVPALLRLRQLRANLRS